MGGVQREQPGAVVQYDAGAGHDHARAEVGEDAVDEGAGVALPVNHADVDGVATGDGLAVGSGGHGPAAVYQRAALGSVVLGEKLLGGNVHHAGVGDIAVGVGEGQAHRLYEVVVGVGRLRSHRSDVEALGDVQGLQGGEALPVGRAFPAGYAAVVGGYRLVPVGGVGGQVIGGQPTAVLLDEGGHLAGDGAAIEGVATFVGDGPHRGGQGGHPHHVAFLGGVAVEQHFLAGGIGTQLRQIVLPLPGDNLRYGEAFLGVADGWLQQAREGHGATLGAQSLPAVDGAGHGYGVGASAGHGPVALGDQLLDVGCCRGATTAVDGAHRLLFLVPDQRE